MKLLFLLTAFLGYTSAYGDVGAYERLLYYYAYRVDAQINGGTPVKFATGCRKVEGSGKSKICSFNEFNKFIFKANGNEVVDSWIVVNEPDAKNPSLPDPDTVARTMQPDRNGNPAPNRGLGSKYNANKVCVCM